MPKREGLLVHTIKAANQTISEDKGFQQVVISSDGLEDVSEYGSTKMKKMEMLFWFQGRRNNPPHFKDKVSVLIAQALMNQMK